MAREHNYLLTGSNLVSLLFLQSLFLIQRHSLVSALCLFAFSMYVVFPYTFCVNISCRTCIVASVLYSCFSCGMCILYIYILKQHRLLANNSALLCKKVHGVVQVSSVQGYKNPEGGCDNSPWSLLQRRYHKECTTMYMKYIFKGYSLWHKRVAELEFLYYGMYGP